MNWEPIAAVAEVVGAIGVIITLIYLAIQIKQSTRMMRVSAKQEQTTVGQNFIFQFAEHPEIWRKLQTNETLTELEESILEILIRGGSRGWESFCYMNDAGLFEEEEWGALKRSLQKFVSHPHIRKIYEDIRPELSTRLCGVLDPVLDEQQPDA
ncbi:MAG: hypothetical protein ACU84Q_20485 [Gammaproteobacteria bacterium]